MPNNKPCIAISMGDPAGVGAELICHVLANVALARRARFIVVGAEKVLARAQKIVAKKFVADFALLTPPLNLSPRTALPPYRKWSATTGAQSFAWAQTAIQLCRDQTPNAPVAVVTAPICKAAWAAAGVEFTGHTDLLRAECNAADATMMLVGGGLRVALVTTHLPLKIAIRQITAKKIIHHAIVLHRDLQNRFNLKNPRLGLLGLNPHAGENGELGDEEKNIMLPAVKKLRHYGMRISPPIAADTAFYRMLNGEFEALLAMYHDQGLAPLKTIAFADGINVTLGLPIVRTSPDHGTAFDLAGKNRANPQSMLNAVKLAMELARI